MWFRQIFDFRVKDLKFSIFVKIFIKFVQFWSKIEILWSRVNDLKFWFSLGLRISNFTNLPKSKFYKNHQILSKKFLISQILWVLGTKKRWRITQLSSKSARIARIPRDARWPTIVLKFNDNFSWKPSQIWNLKIPKIWNLKIPKILGLAVDHQLLGERSRPVSEDLFQEFVIEFFGDLRIFFSEIGIFVARA